MQGPEIDELVRIEIEFLYRPVPCLVSTCPCEGGEQYILRFGPVFENIIQMVEKLGGLSTSGRGEYFSYAHQNGSMVVSTASAVGASI